jgi:hypothetical protein
MNIYDYDPHKIKLANEIADTLNDRDALPLYLIYARKYQETFLRKILAKVMSIPESKIRRTRGALFTFLVNQGNANGDSRH